MAAVSTKVVLPNREPTAALITVGLRLDRPIGEILSNISKKYEEELPKVPIGPSDLPWAFIATDELSGRGIWLSEDRTIGSYDLKPQWKVELRPRNLALKITLPDKAIKTVVVDRTRPVCEIVAVIAEKLSIGPMAATYGLRRSLEPAQTANVFSPDLDSRPGDGQGARDNLSTADQTNCNQWLRSDETLEAQGVKETDNVVFSKRFIDTTPSDEIINLADSHLTFFEAMMQYLSGMHDHCLTQDLVLELSAILLIHVAGRVDTKISTSIIHENADAIYPVRWRRKSKDLAARLAAAHATASSNSWSLHQQELKHQFVQSMRKLPSFGCSIFTLDSFELSNDTSIAAVTVTITSRSVVLQAPKPTTAFLPMLHWSDREKGAVSSVTFDTLAIPTCSWQGETFKITFILYNGAQLVASTKTTSAFRMYECLQGYQAAAQLRAAAAPGAGVTMMSPTTGTIHATRSPVDVISLASPTTLSEAAVIVNQTLEQDLRQFKRALLLEQSGAILEEDETSEESQDSSMSISQWFSQAATHLRSVKKGMEALGRKFLTGSTLTQEDVHNCVEEVLHWTVEAHSMVRCLLKSSEQGYCNAQTLSTLGSNIVGLCQIYMGIVSKISPGHSVPHRTKVQLVVAERATAVACSSLDLALRGQLADENTALSLLFICRDIKATSSEMLREAKRIARSEDRGRTSRDPDRESSLGSEAISLTDEMAKAKGIFDCNTHALMVCAPVNVASDPDLVEAVRSCMEALRSSANSLISTAVQRDPDSEESDTQRLQSMSRLRWAWGCLDELLQTFGHVAFASELPITDVDPMLPPIVAELASVADSAVAMSRQDFKRGVDVVMPVAVGVNRTLATLARLEKSPLIISLSARLEKVMDGLRKGSSKDRIAKRSVHTVRGKPVKFDRNPEILELLNISIDAVSQILRPPAAAHDKMRFELRLLICQLVLLRSTIYSMNTDPLKAVDVGFAHTLLEEVDVVMHQMIPTTSTILTHLATPQGLSSSVVRNFEKCLDEWRSQLVAILGLLDGEESPQKLSYYWTIVRSARKRLLFRWTECRNVFDISSIEAAQPPESRATLSSSSDIPVRRASTSLFHRNFERGTFKALSVSKSSETLSPPLSPSSSRRRSSNSDEGFGPLIARLDGNVDITSEDALLDLVEDMVETGEYSATELSYKDALDLCLLTCPYWTTPETLLGRIIIPLNVSKRKFADPSSPAMRVVVCINRLLRFLPDIVRDPGCRILLNDTITTFRRADPTYDEGIELLESAIADSLDALSKSDRLKDQQLSIAATDNTSRKIDLLTVDLQLLADQMTLAEQMYFDCVNVPDFTKTAWTKHQNALSLWIDHTNSVARWVASRILQTPHRKDRAKIIARLLKLTDLLREKSNLASMITIFLGLSMEGVTRLRKTWEVGNGALITKFERLSDAIMPLNNFSGYREHLKSAQLPCIPYMAVLTRDIVNLQEVMSALKPTAPEGSTLTGNLLNFSHLGTLSRLIYHQFLRFKKSHYQGEPDPIIFPELLHPAAFDVLPDKDQLSEADKFGEEKRTTPRRVVLPSLMSRSMPNIADALDGKSTYGVRTQLTRLNLKTSSGASPPPPGWLANVKKCSSLVETTARDLSELGKMRLADEARRIVSEMNIMIKSYEDDPNSNSARSGSAGSNSESGLGSASGSLLLRSKTLGDTQDNETESIASVLKTQDRVLKGIFERATEIPGTWKSSSSIPAEAKKSGLFVEGCTHLHSLVIELSLLIAQECQNVLSATMELSGARTSLEISADNTIATIKYAIRARGSSSSSGTAANLSQGPILSNLSPLNNQQFGSFNGSLDISRASEDSILSTIQVVVPLRILQK